MAIVDHVLTSGLGCASQAQLSVHLYCSLTAVTLFYYLYDVNCAMVEILFRKNISFVRLDGTLNQQQREKVIQQFSEEKSLTV